MQPNLQKVGQITKPHGFKGHLQVRLFENLKLNWFKEPVFLELQEQPVPFFIENFSEKNNGIVIIKLKDCNSEQEALKFKGFNLMVNRELIINKTNFSYLINWEFKDIVSNKSGIIFNVIESPHQTLIQARVQEKEVFIPLVEEFIIDINNETKTLSLQLPHGLLEIYL